MQNLEALLSHIAKLREERGIWTALPKDIARWWRQRSEMRLVEDENGLRIEGEGQERARIAYASEKDGRLVFEVCPSMPIAYEEIRTLRNAKLDNKGLNRS